jgi:hypothetical protein
LSTSGTRHPEMSGTAPPRREGDPRETHDVSFARSEAEETPAVATDQNRRVSSLDGKGLDCVAGHAIMPTGEGDLFTVEQTFDKGDGLGQPLDADASRVEAQSCLIIFGLHVPGAQAELEPTFRPSQPHARPARNGGSRCSARWFRPEGLSSPPRR